MKYNFTLLCCLTIFNLSFAQTLEATKLELNYHADSDPQNFTSFQSGFFFTATDGYSKKFGKELWYSDGTKEKIFMVKDIMSGQNSSNPNSLTAVGNVLFFTAYEGVHGTELWKSDGTEKRNNHGQRYTSK